MSSNVPVYAEALASELPADWRVAPFEDLVFFQEGPGIRNWQYVDQGVPFVNIRCLVDGCLDRASMSSVSENEAFGKYRHFLLDADDYVVSSSGTLGRIATVREEDLPCMLNTSIIRMRPQDGRLDRRYLKYFLLSSYYQTQVKSFATGSAQLNYGPSHLRQMFIAAPLLDEQRAIAGVLGALDDKIEQNRRTAQALEKLARAIFRARFVDFEPVKAKAAGATSFPSMPQPIFDALPTTFVDSDIGPVPEGWDVGTVEDLATLSKAQVKPQEHLEEPFDHFSIPAFDAGMHAMVELGSGIKSNKFLVIDGCVLLSKLNPRIARIWLPPLACDRRQITSTEFLVFVPREPSDRHYLYCQFQQREFREELAQEASGTSNSHQRVRPNDVLSRPVVMPVPSIRQAFADITDPLFALQLANHDESVKLAQMRDYLLPKLLSGTLRVRDAERAAATVA